MTEPTGPGGDQQQARAAVDFTHLDDGTPARSWRQRHEWGQGPAVPLAGLTRLLVVAAHPDDESLGAGGLIAAAARSGVQVEVACATDGEGSHPDSPTTTAPQLATLRVQEGRRAASLLGIAAPHRLGLPDGGVRDAEEDLTRWLVELVGDGRDTVLVAPWREDGHPDHEAAGRAAAVAARRTGADLWEYPVWFWHWGEPADAPWDQWHTFHPDAAAVEAKQAAIGAHRSQVAPLSSQPGDDTLLGPDLLAHFAGGPEHFRCTPSSDCPDDALDLLHQDDRDPWGAESRWYERRKRDLLLAMLPRPRFERAIEIGCSTGVLTQELASRCTTTVAVDRSVTAVEGARERLRGVPGVEVSLLDLPRQWPVDEFDLVVVSEVGYFLSPPELGRLVEAVQGSLAAQGVVVLCHWRHPIAGWPLDAASVHEAFAASGLPPAVATYQDRDVEIVVHAHPADLPDATR